MRQGFLGLVTTFLAGTSMALAQPVPPPSAKPEPPPGVEKAPAPTPRNGGPSVKDHAAPAPVPAGVEWIGCGSAGCLNERCWIEADYLLWSIKNGPLSQPLVTSGPPESGGILGNPGVRRLIGGSGIDYEAFSGARLTVGRWLNPDQTIGFEGSGFFLEEDSVVFVAISDPTGAPLLARPIRNAQTDGETSVLIASPGQFTGGVDVTATSQLWGAEANLLGNLLRQGGTSLDLLVGFRYVNLDEDLDIRTNSVVQPGGVASFGGTPVLSPNGLAIRDIFATCNEFYGGQIGARGTFRRDRLRVDVTGKVAFGLVHQQLRVSGFTTLVTPEGIFGTLPGGVLAVRTNSGRRTFDDGAVVPEAQIRIGYQITQRLSAHVGYTLIYWDNVLRPGDQVSRIVNLTQVPSSLGFGPLTGPRDPQRLNFDSRFWAQGVNFGLALRF